MATIAGLWVKSLKEKISSVSRYSAPFRICLVSLFDKLSAYTNLKQRNYSGDISAAESGIIRISRTSSQFPFCLNYFTIPAIGWTTGTNKILARYFVRDCETIVDFTVFISIYKVYWITKWLIAKYEDSFYTCFSREISLTNLGQFLPRHRFSCFYVVRYNIYFY